MSVNWIDVTGLSFNTLLLLERAQLSWFPNWLPEPELAIALQANPAVEWYLRHKCREINSWVDSVMAQDIPLVVKPEDVRKAEITVMNSINDLLVYVVNPNIYESQPFLAWDSKELSEMLDYRGKTVLDIGAGTGRLTFVAAETAKTVFCVEPVGNLRRFIKAKAKRLGMDNVFTVDGLITDIPFPDDYADVVIGGHVFGDHPEEEYQEVIRVTRSGGMVIFCPGNNDKDNETHEFLVSKGFAWSRFEEPQERIKRKYWLTVEK